VEDNIKMDLQEVGFEGVDWIDLAQDKDRWQALKNVVVNLWPTGKLERKQHIAFSREVLMEAAMDLL
jgi:hypothetical protein